MKNIKLNIGGELAPGDVVGVAYTNCVVFGWYVESGQYGSLKFIPFRVPEYVENQYNNHVATPTNSYLNKRYEKGLLFKHFRKDYIVQFGAIDNRAFKVSNPEEFFKDSAVEPIYLKAREILRKINFPAK